MKKREDPQDFLDKFKTEDYTDITEEQMSKMI